MVLSALSTLSTLTTHDALVGLSILISTYLAYWLIGYVRVCLQVRGLPTIHSWIEFFESGARSKLPHIPFLVPVDKYTLDDPYKKYNDVGSDLIALTQVTTPHAVYITASPTAAQTISTKSNIFLKPTGMFRYQAINIFGLQLVSTQTGAEHRRHKSVVKACFNENIMEVGWNKMVEAVNVMIREEGLENGGLMKNVKTCMIKATLLVIGQAGFSIEVPWNIPHSEGTILPFSEALDMVETSMIPQLLLPLWLMTYSPSAYLRRCAKAQRSLILHIKDMLRSRRERLTEERATLLPGEKVKPPQDILGALVAGQMEAEDEAALQQGETKMAGLTDKEIIGNTFVFIVAGHETTGHTLTWILGYLALYPDIQNEVYEEIRELCDGQPTYRHMPVLRLTLACCYESLRLRDLVMTLPKLAAEDTMIPYTTWDAAGNIAHHTRAIKKGSHVIIDSPACQRNPRFWSDPTVFNPKRHYGQGSKESSARFTGFSMGSRQCIGKRFAEVEMVALISHIVKRFKLCPVPLDGEDLEATRKRYEKGSEELSFTPDNWDIRLDRR